MVDVSAKDDACIVQYHWGHSIPEAAIQAVNQMLRTSVITCDRVDGTTSWTAEIDGHWFELTLDKDGKVIGQGSGDDNG